MSKILETLDKMTECGVSFRVGPHYSRNSVTVDVGDVAREAAAMIRELEDEIADLKTDLREARES